MCISLQARLLGAPRSDVPFSNKYTFFFKDGLRDDVLHDLFDLQVQSQKDCMEVFARNKSNKSETE